MQSLLTQFFSISRSASSHVVIGLGLSFVFLLSIFFLPLNLAPEFTGQAQLTLSFTETPTKQQVTEALTSLNYSVRVEQDADSAFRFSSRSLDETAYSALLGHIEETVGGYTIIDFQSFSPSISQELVRKALLALIAGLFLVVLYISYAFRGVSHPIASWKYGAVSIVALLHDVILPFGIFALISPFTSAVIDTLFVTALLATLGYSINDTIVIFDRIRDRLQSNKERKRKESFEQVVDHGVQKSVRRSLFTSISTIIPLVLLALLVPVTKWFAFALFIGVCAGTYSSLFLAPSLLLLWHKRYPQPLPKPRVKSETEQAEDILRATLKGEDVL